MQSDDFENFARVLDAAYSLHSKSLNADARALFFAALTEYSLPDVRKAFQAHLKDPQRGQFPPKPADLIAHLQGDVKHDGRPDADEAWAISYLANDESETIVWTEECSQAFHRASIIDDETGRRMAFKSAYTRIVATARERGDAVRWVKSLGHDVQRRDVVLAQAVRDGRLTLADVRAIAPHVLEDLREEQALAEVQKLTAKFTARLPS